MKRMEPKNAFIYWTLTEYYNDKLIFSEDTDFYDIKLSSAEKALN